MMQFGRPTVLSRTSREAEKKTKNERTNTGVLLYCCDAPLTFYDHPRIASAEIKSATRK